MVLCGTCEYMLRGQGGRQWKGTYDLNYNHHDSVQKLEDSVIHKCAICRAISDELRSKLGSEQPSAAKELAITACISEISSAGKYRLWRLDFKIRYDRDLKCQRVFIPKEISELCMVFILARKTNSL